MDGLQDSLRDKYPQWEIVPYETPRECLRAAEEGSADCAMVSSLKLSADRNLLGVNLVAVDGSTADTAVYMGVSDDADPILVQVLSKSIAKTRVGAMDESVYAILLSTKETKDFSYFIQTYPLYFAGGVVAVSLLCQETIRTRNCSRWRIPHYIRQKPAVRINIILRISS